MRRRRVQRKLEEVSRLNNELNELLGKQKVMDGQVKELRRKRDDSSRAIIERSIPIDDAVQHAKLTTFQWEQFQLHTVTSDSLNK